MKRCHRRLHVFMWLLLGPIALTGLILGINARVTIPPQEPPVANELPASPLPTKEVAPK